MMGTFIVAMTVTVTNTMLPAIIKSYQITATTAQWLTSGATLVSGIMIPIAAYFIKRFQSKTYFLSAMIIFSFGALLDSIAPNFTVLLVGRLIQAVGCGMLMPFAQIVLMTIYPKENHGFVMAIYALGSTFAPVIAPSLAGLVIDSLGWQSMFTILLIIGLIIIVLGFAFMKNVTETYKGRFPLLAAILSSVGFCALLIGLGNLSTASILSMETGGALVIGLASLGLFVYTQLRSEIILLNLQIFRYQLFRTAVYMSVVMYLVCMGNGVLLPIFTQSVLGHSATVYALVTLPGAFVMAVVTVFSGRIYDKLGSKPLMICGIFMLTLGSILGIMFHQNNGLLHIGIVSCLLSAGTGFLNTPATTMGLSDLEGKNRVDGSSIFNTLRQISSSIASTFAIVAYTIISSKQGNNISGIKGTYIFYLGFSVLAAIIAFNFLRNYNKVHITTSDGEK